MKAQYIPLLCAILFVCGFICGGLLMIKIGKHEGIHSRHRITPRLELVIDSGRVDTVFVYKLK